MLAAGVNDVVEMDEVQDKDSFERLLKYFYSGQLPKDLSVFNLQLIVELCKLLKLSNSLRHFRKLCEQGRSKIQKSLAEDPEFLHV